MAPRKYRLHDAKAGAALAVRVTPRASRNRITAVLGDGTVKIQLTAPPVDGEANTKLIAFLAEVLDVPKSHIEIVAGATGRDKLVTVTGMNAAALHERILASLN
jgi:uncharacterized protein (TIGR00251 family)